MRRKTIHAIAIVAGLVAMLSTSIGHAAAQGGGEVQGTVTITTPSTGIPPVCPTAADRVNTVYTFSGVLLNGTITNNGKVFAGSISTSGVTGKGVSECGDSGSGTVNSATSPASFSGTAGPMSTSGTFYGTYTRTASHVVVKLKASGTVCDPTGCSSFSNANVNLDASEFIPTAVDPGTGGLKQASFTGEFLIGRPQA